MSQVVLETLVARGLLPDFNCGALSFAFVTKLPENHWRIKLSLARAVFALLRLLDGLVRAACPELGNHALKSVIVKALETNRIHY